eukprot:SAG31_NODE_5168_length_2702_cov_2.425663_2_plen_231_part_00
MQNSDPGQYIDDVLPDPSIYMAAEVKEITLSNSVEAACGEARVCLIGLLDKMDSFHSDHMTTLEAVALKQAAQAGKGEVVPVTWIDASQQGAFIDAFGVSGLPTVVVYAPGSGDYGQLVGAFDEASINKVVKKAVQFTKRALTSNLKELPALVEPVEIAPAEEDDFDLSELMGDVLDSAGDEDDDDYGDGGMSERGPARLNKKKKKKKKKGGDKEDKSGKKKKKKAKKEL